MRITKFWIIAISAILVGCNSKTADFSFKPEKPRAGEVVAFSNLSNTGEDWAWTFGDNTSSTSKSPVKTYRMPGTYTVTLKVDNKRSLSRTKQITIYDTVPNFSASFVDSIGASIYESVQFKSLVYNPYNYTVTTEWSVVPEECFVKTDSSRTTELVGYFCQATECDVRMHIQLDETDTTIVHRYTIRDIPTEALLMRTAEGDLVQRIFGIRAEDVKPLTYADGKALLDAAEEGPVFANRRYYDYGAEGLWVSFADGSNKVFLTEKPVTAIYADVVDNRIYWAESDGVMYLPLIDTPNNHFTKRPTRLNTVGGVNRLAKDNEKR